MITKTHKIALITGAASGIGRETARLLAGQGFVVYATDRDREGLAQEAERLRGEGGKIHDCYLDVTDPTSIATVMAQIEETQGGLDVLINNAGYALLGPVEEINDADVRQQFEVNFFGVLNVKRAALPLLRKRRGRIINLSSMMGRVTSPGWGIYSATKYGVEAVSDALRMELAPWGMPVILIEPGNILTNFSRTANSQMPTRFLDDSSRYPGLRPLLQDYNSFSPGVSPQKVAQIILKASTTKRPQARYMVNWSSRLDVMLYEILPTWFTDWAVRRRIGYNRGKIRE